MKDREASREEKVRKCFAEIQSQLPNLESVHTPLVVIAGLAEYLGSTLHLARRLNACSCAQARVISERVRQIASTDLKLAVSTNDQSQLNVR
jgi:hypothetical protein